MFGAIALISVCLIPQKIFGQPATGSTHRNPLLEKLRQNDNIKNNGQKPRLITRIFGLNFPESYHPCMYYLKKRFSEDMLTTEYNIYGNPSIVTIFSGKSGRDVLWYGGQMWKYVDLYFTKTSTYSYLYEISFFDTSENRNDLLDKFEYIKNRLWEKYISDDKYFWKERNPDSCTYSIRLFDEHGVNRQTISVSIYEALSRGGEMRLYLKLSYVDNELADNEETNIINEL